ncbi:MAG: M48 family metallopeptidase [Thermoguttaceae bacterium]|nr:M48 family metallopeptidase [Thermoguttaceae bacterium]
MQFFAHQDRARSQTKWLAMFFFVAIIGVVVSVTAVLTGFFMLIQRHPGGDSAATASISQIPLNTILYTALATLGLILCAVWVRSSQLRSGGGRYVAESLGGQLIPPNTTDQKQRQLLNIVEEMSIASGVPVPAVYLLREESGINAFAAGNSPQTAVIGVTKGALELFTRDELQGVIGHEFSHILEEDMSISMRLMAWLYGIAILSLVGLMVCRFASELSFYGGLGHSSSNNDNDNRGLSGLALALALLVCGGLVWLIGLIGGFCGSLIQAAISRQREFLADASAVQFTRNSTGIASALKKIQNYSQHGKLRAARGEMQYLFFTASMSSLLATHPPLDERIRRILNGASPDTLPTSTIPRSAVSSDARVPSPTSRFPRSTRSNAAAVSGLAAGLGEMVRGDASTNSGIPPIPSTDSAVVSPESATHLSDRPPIRQEVPPIHADIPLEFSLDRAAGICQNLPAELVIASREAWSARGIIFALLLPSEPGAQDAQLAVLRQSEPQLAMTVTRITAPIRQLAVDEQMVLSDLTIRTLRSMSISQTRNFLTLLETFVMADGRVSLFEGMFVVVTRGLLRQKAGEQTGFSESRQGSGVSNELSANVRIFLGILAYQGTDSPTAAASAFAKGCEAFDGTTTPIPSMETCALRYLYDILTRLQQSDVRVRTSILHAAMATIAADGVVTLREAQLLRMIGAALEIPIPPVLPDVS